MLWVVVYSQHRVARCQQKSHDNRTAGRTFLDTDFLCGSGLVLVPREGVDGVVRNPDEGGPLQEVGHILRDGNCLSVTWHQTVQTFGGCVLVVRYPGAESESQRQDYSGVLLDSVTSLSMVSHDIGRIL